jgi:hypothetical protein
MALPLPELFPDEDYRFHLTLRKANLGEFFGSPDAAVLAERQRWLKLDSSRYAAATGEAEPLLAEFEALAASWSPALASDPAGDDAVVQRLVALGRKLEPDFMLLAKDEAGTFRLRAGVVCFPSSWALTEKMGLTLDGIHGVVPGLNPGLGATIGQFLGKLRPGSPYERANWGLAATPELNLHPGLARPRLALPFDAQGIWVRIEDQILAALPVTGGILFGIRLRLVPLVELLNDRQLKAGFHRALTSMPGALVAYKGFDLIRNELIVAST